MKQKRRIRYTYLTQQFAHSERYIRKVKQVVAKGDFTLGKELVNFESNFARKLQVKHAIGVANGTDALYLPLKAIGIAQGDEVITVPNSFVATAAAIALTGARPVFVDVRDDFTIDPNLIEKAITRATKAIIPVHLTGISSDMHPILQIARAHNLFVLEDVAQAAFTKYDNKYVGTWGHAGSFSFHPLKVLNIWGDGGVITTNDDDLAYKLRLWRNHGLTSREEVEFFAHNSRLDTIQAAVANVLLSEVDTIVSKRARNARLYDRYLNSLDPWVHVPKRDLGSASVEPAYSTYVVQVLKREMLIKYLEKNGIDAVIHYPIPIHLQKAAKYLGYKRGDFPVTEKQAETILTLPNHQYMTREDVAYICEVIKEFYNK